MPPPSRLPTRCGSAGSGCRRSVRRRCRPARRGCASRSARRTRSRTSMRWSTRLPISRRAEWTIPANEHAAVDRVGRRRRAARAAARLGAARRHLGTAGCRAWRSAIACMRSICPATATARRCRRSRSMRWCARSMRRSPTRRRSRSSAGRSAGRWRCAGRSCGPRASRASCSSARRRGSSPAPDWPHAMSEATLQRFGDELTVAWKLTVQRFLALQVHGSEHGRAALALLRHDLFARGEPSPQMLAEALAVLADDRPARRRRRASRSPRWSSAGERDMLTPPGAGRWLAAPSAGRALRRNRRRRACAVPVASRRFRRGRGGVPRWPMTTPSTDGLRDPTRGPCGVPSRARRRPTTRAAVLQKEVGARMAERLDFVRLAPRAVLDAGCGTGDALAELARRAIRRRAASRSTSRCPCCGVARARARAGSLLRSDRLLGAAARRRRRAARLRLRRSRRAAVRAGAFDLVWSNLRRCSGCNDLPRAFAECHRVLAVGGLFMFTTFGPDTLKEVRAAFARVDALPHVSRFVDMHDIGDMLVAAGFADPVMEMEYMTLTYPDALAMLRDLKAIGATNAARGRARGLMGRARWRKRPGGDRRDAHGDFGPRERDVRGDLRPRVEGGADAHRRRARDRAARAQALTMAASSATPTATRGIFVTGTDTGVGKTRIAVALLRALAAQGVRAVGMKPVAAGIEPGAGRNRRCRGARRGRQRRGRARRRESVCADRRDRAACRRRARGRRHRARDDRRGVPAPRGAGGRGRRRGRRRRDGPARRAPRHARHRVARCRCRCCSSSASGSAASTTRASRRSRSARAASCSPAGSRTGSIPPWRRPTKASRRSRRRCRPRSSPIARGSQMLRRRSTRARCAPRSDGRRRSDSHSVGCAKT